MNTKRLGDLGEEAAASYLLARHYVIKERQYRCRWGEIDLIAEKDGVLIFIEVKTRQNVRYGVPAEAVNFHKQQKIIRTAAWYLTEHPPAERACRFDVVEVYFPAAGGRHIKQYKNAFEA